MSNFEGLTAYWLFATTQENEISRLDVTWLKYLCMYDFPEAMSKLMELLDSKDNDGIYHLSKYYVELVKQYIPKWQTYSMIQALPIHKKKNAIIGLINSVKSDKDLDSVLLSISSHHDCVITRDYYLEMQARFEEMAAFIKKNNDLKPIGCNAEKKENTTHTTRQTKQKKTKNTSETGETHTEKKKHTLKKENMSKKNMVTTFIIWFVLNVLVGLTMDFALFTQTVPAMKNANIFAKILASEFWASVEWMFLIPANRMGNSFLTAAQISLSSYVFDFLAQIWSNTFWLHLPTTIDDYTGMILILFGMYSAKYTLFG